LIRFRLRQIQMLGYDISWAGFNIIEVMSSSRFTCKRIGYLAASQCFHPDSEVIFTLLTALKKAFNFDFYFPHIAAAHADHEYDTQGSQLTESIRCGCGAQWTELLYIARSVPRLGQWYYDTGMDIMTLWLICTYRN